MAFHRISHGWRRIRTRDGLKLRPGIERMRNVVDACLCRDLRKSTLKKYDVLFRQLKALAGAWTFQLEDLATQKVLPQSWKDKGISAVKKLERLRAFFNFAVESGWVSENTAKKLKNPKVTQEPTLPYSQDEVIKILGVCANTPDNYGKVGGINGARLRALVLMLRIPE